MMVHDGRYTTDGADDGTRRTVLMMVPTDGVESHCAFNVEACRRLQV